MSNVSIMAGNGSGDLAAVGSDGSLRTAVVNTVAVEVLGPVTVEKEGLTVHRTNATVVTTSDTLLAARAGRQWLFVRNVGSNPCYLRFEDEDATVADWPLSPGEEFRAEDFRYEGVVTAISEDGATDVVALEMAP